jgi:hypothetical protein
MCASQEIIRKVKAKMYLTIYRDNLVPKVFDEKILRFFIELIMVSNYEPVKVTNVWKFSLYKID